MSNMSTDTVDVAGTTVVLLGQIAKGWEVLQPLTVTIQYSDEDGTFITGDEVFYMYGTGGSISESLGDYIKVLTEYYEHLAEDEDEPTKALFEYVRSYVNATAL
jgi:hypothetical protein